MNEVIVIPDVHGRTFWKDAVERYPDADIIFLGDFLDPYPVEGITPENAIANFEEIIAFAKVHANCQLLFGNHDLHYICNFGEACRLDYTNSAHIHFLFSDNMWLFKLVTTRCINGRKVVFSHAPILNEWVDAVGETRDVDLLVNHLNALLSKINRKPREVEPYLGQISVYRGGFDEFGSPVWADVNEIDHDNVLSTADYSIFGHTQQANDPIITEKWACLDCRRAFIISPDLQIITL